MDIIELRYRYTNTTIFLMPLLFEGLTKERIITNNFDNCYIMSTNKKELDNTLILVNKGMPVKGGFVIEKRLQKDYENFLAGRYSKFNEDNKVQILKFWRLFDKQDKSLLHSVLYKTDYIIENYWKYIGSYPIKEWLPEVERWPVPDISCEIYYEKGVV